MISLDVAPSFELNEGFVLIADACNERIAGSVFATGGIRYSAIPVPEVFDPPYVIRFVIEK